MPQVRQRSTQLENHRENPQTIDPTHKPTQAPITSIKIRAFFDQSYRTQIVFVEHNRPKIHQIDFPELRHLPIERKPVTKTQRGQNDPNKIQQIAQVANIANKPQDHLSSILFQDQPRFTTASIPLDPVPLPLDPLLLPPISSFLFPLMGFYIIFHPLHHKNQYKNFFGYQK